MISGAGSVPRINGSGSRRDVQKHPGPEPQRWSKPNLVPLLARSQMTFSAAQISALALTNNFIHLQDVKILEQVLPGKTNF
jgi:hypothetical protein